MLITIIIIVSVILFFSFVLLINYQDIKKKLSSGSSKKTVVNKLPEENKEKPKKYKVDDFIPIVKDSNPEDNRDESLQSLFEKNRQQSSPIINEDDNNSSELFPNNIDANNDPELQKFLNSLSNNEQLENKNSTIAEQINNLPPEIKILVLDNVLKKRDDV